MVHHYYYLYNDQQLPVDHLHLTFLYKNFIYDNFVPILEKQHH